MITTLKKCKDRQCKDIQVDKYNIKERGRERIRNRQLDTERETTREREREREREEGRNILICRQIERHTTDQSIHGYSPAPFRARRVSLEVAWGVHVHRCSRKHGPTLHCTKCRSPLNNTHILGGRGHTAKLRTKRHNNTFLLLHLLLQTTNGGRWPIIGIDLGNKPVIDFSKHIPDTEATTLSHLPPISGHKGLQDDKPNTQN